MNIGWCCIKSNYNYEFRDRKNMYQHVPCRYIWQVERNKYLIWAKLKYCWTVFIFHFLWGPSRAVCFYIQSPTTNMDNSTALGPHRVPDGSTMDLHESLNGIPGAHLRLLNNGIWLGMLISFNQFIFMGLKYSSDKSFKCHVLNHNSDSGNSVD